MKVYYIPIRPFYNQVTVPVMLTALPLIRDILIRERITILHGHGAFSALCHEGILHAGTLGVRTVFTDHSLFGFADGSSILTNKLLEVVLTDIDHVICVSYTSKENTVLRAVLKPETVSVIPNAVDSVCFTPDPSQSQPDRVTVVVVSRLVYRKGADLLAGLIPLLCHRHKDLHFIIGGDGPKRVVLEEVREKYQLHDRVSLLGGLQHSQVRGVLVQGDIFLNTSLTEAFCIAIVEAASCGLQVISTRVGGVPEVLPDDLISLADPNINALAKALEEAIENHRHGNRVPHWEMHERVGKMYTWHNVARRTEQVYDMVARAPTRSMWQRMQRYHSRDPVMGKVYVALLVLLHLLTQLVAWWSPAKTIDCVPDLLTSEHNVKH
jgi:phosphatidylinositol glycan class A protein